MTAYTHHHAALWQAATSLADRGIRIAMVQLGWNTAKGEKVLIRNPPKDWHTAVPFPSTQVKAAIDGGCNAYLWRLPDGWWVVDADTAELKSEYTGLLGPPDVVTPRGAHWVVDAPARKLHKLDTGVRGFYGPGSFYPGPDGALRVYTGAVPAAPRPLPESLRRPSFDFGPVSPDQPTSITPEAAAFSVSRARDQWLSSIKGGRHFAMRDYFAVLARCRLAQGADPATVADELQAAADEHPDAQTGEEFSSAESLIHWVVDEARAKPWKIEAAQPGTLESRFAPPDPGDAPVAADTGDGGELFAPGSLEYFRNPPPPPKPIYGTFGGALPLFYDSGVHWLQGESESGKSWVAFAVALEVLRIGGWALIVDHEDTRGNVLRRLQALGMTEQEYQRLVYVSGPDVTHAELRAHLGTTERDYAVMVIDGVASALNDAGLSANDGQELTRWVDQLPRQARMSICIDHVVKAVDDRRGMAVGSYAKKAVVTGSSFEVVATSVFGRGLDGVIELRLQKDKGGFLRGELGRHAVRLHLRSGDDGAKVRIEAGARSQTGGFFDDPNESLFSALLADGFDGGVSGNELWRAAKERQQGYSSAAAKKASMLDAWRRYYAEQANSSEA